MAGALTGGCACGAVRYTCAGAAKFAFHCQCRDCQHISGSGHTTQFAIDGEDFDVTGGLTWWERQNGAGFTVSKGFCTDCGSPVYGFTSRYPNNMMVMAGSLDDPALIAPDRIFFADESQPWDHQTIQKVQS